LLKIVHRLTKKSTWQLLLFHTIHELYKLQYITLHVHSLSTNNNIQTKNTTEILLSIYINLFLIMYSFKPRYFTIWFTINDLFWFTFGFYDTCFNLRT